MNQSLTSSIGNQQLEQRAQAPDELFPLWSHDEETNTFKRLEKFERRAIVHTQGLLHGSVNVYVLFNVCGSSNANANLQIKTQSSQPFKESFVLIQQRSQYKKIEPLKWDVSVAEHLQQSDDDHFTAARRGLAEELCLDANTVHDWIRLRSKTKYDWKYPEQNVHDVEVTELYLAIIHLNLKDDLNKYMESLKLEDSEVAQVKLLTFEEFETLTTKSRHQLTRWGALEADHLVAWWRENHPEKISS